MPPSPHRQRPPHPRPPRSRPRPPRSPPASRPQLLRPPPSRRQSQHRHSRPRSNPRRKRTLAPSPEPTIQPTPEASPIATAGTTIEVELAGGKPVNGVRRVRIKARDTVTIIVNGDTTDELHIHGYDLVVPFAPGRPGHPHLRVRHPRHLRGGIPPPRRPGHGTRSELITPACPSVCFSPPAALETWCSTVCKMECDFAAKWSVDFPAKWSVACVPTGVHPQFVWCRVNMASRTSRGTSPAHSAHRLRLRLHRSLRPAANYSSPRMRSRVAMTSESSDRLVTPPRQRRANDLLAVLGHVGALGHPFERLARQPGQRPIP